MDLASKFTQSKEIYNDHGLSPTFFRSHLEGCFVFFIDSVDVQSPVEVP